MSEFEFVCRLVVPIMVFLIAALIIAWFGYEDIGFFVSNGGMALVLAANVAWTGFHRRY